MSTVDMAVPSARLAGGNNSATMTHGTGPQPTENEKMNTISAAAAASGPRADATTGTAANAPVCAQKNAASTCRGVRSLHFSLRPAFELFFSRSAWPHTRSF